MKPERALIAISIAVSAFVVRGPAAWSCSCATATIQEQFRNSSVVFAGLAATVESSDRGVVASFAVDDVFKGTVGQNVAIATQAGQAACGVPFIAGQRYAVFARAEAQTLSTDLCSGTTQDARAVAKAGYLPRVRYSVLATSPSPVAAGRTTPGRAGVVVVAVVLLAGAAGAWVATRRRSSKNTPGPSGAGG